MIDLDEFRKGLFRIFPTFETLHYYETEEEYIPIMKDYLTSFMINIKWITNQYMSGSREYLKYANQCIIFLFKYKLFSYESPLYNFYMISIFNDAMIDWNENILQLIIDYNRNNFTYIKEFIRIMQSHFWKDYTVITISSIKSEYEIISTLDNNDYCIKLYDPNPFYDKYNVVLKYLYKVYLTFRFNLFFSKSEMNDIYNIDLHFIRMASEFNNSEIIQTLASNATISYNFFQYFKITNVITNHKIDQFYWYVTKYSIKHPDHHKLRLATYFGKDIIFRWMISRRTDINTNYFKRYIIITQKLYRKCRMIYPLCFDVFMNSCHLIRQRLKNTKYSSKSITNYLNICIQHQYIECAQILIEYIRKHRLQIIMKNLSIFHTKEMEEICNRCQLENTI